MLTAQQAFPRAALSSLDTSVTTWHCAVRPLYLSGERWLCPQRPQAPGMGTRVKFILWVLTPSLGFHWEQASALSSSWSQGMRVQITQPPGVHEALWGHQAGVSGCGKKTCAYEKVSPRGRNKTGTSKWERTRPVIRRCVWSIRYLGGHRKEHRRTLEK